MCGDRDDPEPEPASASGDFSAELLKRLAGRDKGFARYVLKGELARGGQGAILRVWDEDLRRNLAMKVTLAHGESASPSDVDPRTLGRFLEEAQVTGQLDHPGIVPIHELGLDDKGGVYFTMRLVKGIELARVFGMVATGEDGWNKTRVLGVLLKVCEAVGYAHSKHVIHRDLKPANIMVGRFGEVYVMDWGLARVLDGADRKDIRVRPASSLSMSRVKSDRREQAGSAADSPLVTMDGDVIGTPAYMSPEQARGDLEAMGPASDVYSMGAILYQLLAGHMPYVPPGARLNAYAVWGLVQNGPPTPVAQLARETPAELVAICEKAMAREPRDRYADMRKLAEDMRAFLEKRVVSAYETGAVAELRKWVARNRALAASMAAAVLLLVAGLATSLVFKARADQSAVLASERADLAEEQSRIAKENQALAERNAYYGLVLASEAARKEGNHAEAQRRRLLCPEDHRGWEWSHLGLMLDRSLQTLEGDWEIDPMAPVAFSPDRRRIAIASWLKLDQPISVQDLEPAGARLRLEALGGMFWCLAFSPDGRRIATGSMDGSVHIWDAETGAVLQVLEGHTAATSAVAFSSDGRRVVSGSGAGDDFLRVWDAGNGALLQRMGCSEGFVQAVAFSPDGRLVASADGGTQENLVRIWDAGTGAPIRQLKGHRRGPLIPVVSLVFSPDGRRIVTASWDETLRIWDVATEATLHVLEGHEGKVQTVEYSPDGRRILSGSSDGTLRTWDAETGAALQVLEGHTGTVRGAVFRPDGQRILSAASDQTVRVWDAETGAARELLEGHAWEVNDVAFSPDGRRIASACQDGTLLLWDAETGTALPSVPMWARQLGTPSLV